MHEKNGSLRQMVNHQVNCGDIYDDNMMISCVAATFIWRPFNSAGYNIC